MSVGVRGAICIEGLSGGGITFDNTGDFGGYGEIGWGTGVEAGKDVTNTVLDWLANKANTVINDARQLLEQQGEEE